MGQHGMEVKSSGLQLDGLSSYFISVTLLCDFVPISGILMQVYRELLQLIEMSLVVSTQTQRQRSLIHS